MKKRRKIWLAIPSYGGVIHVGTVRSLIHDITQLMLGGEIIYLFTDVGHADIYTARAQIVSHAMSDPQMDELVMIDSDVTWMMGGLVRLLSHDVDVVGGSYPKRELPIKFLLRSAEGPIMADTGSGLAECWGLAGGFVRTRRAALAKMIQHYGPSLTMTDYSVPSEKVTRLYDPYWRVTDQGNKHVLSEDYAFCQRWRDIGGKVYVDVNIEMGHVGMYEYAGKLGEWKSAEPEKPELRKAG